MWKAESIASIAATVIPFVHGFSTFMVEKLSNYRQRLPKAQVVGLSRCLKREAAGMGEVHVSLQRAE